MPKNANNEPGKNVGANCNLLMRQATIITPAAIENGTGKLGDVVNAI